MHSFTLKAAGALFSVAEFLTNVADKSGESQSDEISFRDGKDFKRWHGALLPEAIELDGDLKPLQSEYVQQKLFQTGFSELFTGKAEVCSTTIGTILQVAQYCNQRIPSVLQAISELSVDSLENRSDPLEAARTDFLQLFSEQSFRHSLQRIYGSDDLDSRHQAIALVAAYLRRLANLELRSEQRCTVHLVFGLRFNEEESRSGAGHVWLSVEDKVIDIVCDDDSSEAYVPVVRWEIQLVPDTKTIDSHVRLCVDFSS